MDPLIAAAIQPLAKCEDLCQAAAERLTQTADFSHPAASKTTTRLEKINARRIPRFLVVGLAAAIALGATLSKQIEDLRFAPMFIGDVWDWIQIPAKMPDRSFTTEQRLLLGNPGQPRYAQAEQLHKYAPDNPAYYAEYIVEYSNKHSALPPDYFETVERIAPGNSFFLYWAAGQIGSDSFEKLPSQKNPEQPRVSENAKGSRLPVERDYAIIDQAAFDEAAALLEKAAQLTEFRTYTSEMMAARSNLLPYETFAEYANSTLYVFSAPSPLISLRKAADLFCVQAQVHSRSNDHEKFAKLVSHLTHFMSSQANNPDSNLINELVYSVNAATICSHVHWAADRLGLAEMSRLYQNRMVAFQKDRDLRDASRKLESDYLEKRGSHLSHMTLEMVQRQAVMSPPITNKDLTPLRLVDHEIISRYGITVVALFIAIACLPVFLFRFFWRKPTRVVATHFSKLLTPTDWAWITGLGILVPIALLLVINRHTPLGGRDFSIQAYHFLFPGIHLAAILLCLLLAPAVLIRWRLSIRLAPFAIPCRLGMIPILMIVLLMVWSISAFPILYKTEMSRALIATLAAVPALCVATILLPLLRKPAQPIARIATSATLLPAFAAAIIALCATIPVFMTAEKHRMSQDTLFRITPDAKHLGSYEFRVAAQRRKETNAILGF